ncbi:MAG TPA: DUF559 domain-containing protein [Longimicrobium sp.]|nr:DUF559 domain-containing protein [Longimicrobium sp.]
MDRDCSPEVRQAARRLRREMTPAEERLWIVLRNRAVNAHKFRRQHPLHGFVLDFYCAAAKLCVELDGGVHDEQQERDEARTAVLETHGIRVLRFRNEEVFADVNAVVRAISQAAAAC